MLVNIKPSAKPICVNFESYKEPKIHLSLAVPVKADNFSGNPRRFYGKNCNKEIPMACGCKTEAYLIGAAEENLSKMFGNFDVEQQPPNDFLLTLFCGQCAKQISMPFSAWKIWRFHGGANWIAQNSGNPDCSKLAKPEENFLTM